jgi:hypothetical protein
MPSLPFYGNRSKSPAFVHGVITSADVLRHLPLIWREFGTACALKCIRAVVRRERTTFLDVAYGLEVPAPTVTPPTYRN